jgi:hypothetical protein
MIARRFLAGMVLIGSLILSPGAAAKAFRPGDVSLCRGARCVPLNDRRVLNALASFYYDSATRPVRAAAPRAGTPSLKLAFSNGYVSGTVAGPRLDRFLSGGVNLDQFQDGVWYRVPARVAGGLRSLATRLTAAAGGSDQPMAPGIVALAATIGLGMLALARRRSTRASTLSAR